MTPRKKAPPKPEPTVIHVTYNAGPVTLEADVPCTRVSATLVEMARVHQKAQRTCPDLIPELSPVTSSMGFSVADEDDDGTDQRRPHRLGFTA